MKSSISLLVFLNLIAFLYAESIASVGAKLDLLIKKPRECQDILKMGHKKSGVYTIFPDKNVGVSAYCVMEGNTGWTTMLKRQKQSPQLNFERTWTEYKDGFGDRNKEHYLGNDNIHHIVSHGPHKLEIHVETSNKGKMEGRYNGFHVQNESKMYEVRVWGFETNSTMMDVMSKSTQLYDDGIFVVVDSEFKKKCSANEFKCKRNNKCIPKEKVCDRDHDCPDGSDEVPTKECPKVCASGAKKEPDCFSSSDRCDGKNNTVSGRDELNCHDRCDLKDNFRCKSGECIKKYKKCDKEFDCSDRSDETNCKFNSWQYETGMGGFWFIKGKGINPTALYGSDKFKITYRDNTPYIRSTQMTSVVYKIAPLHPNLD